MERNTSMSVVDQLRAAVEAAEKSGETRYKIAQESRIGYMVLVRFIEREADIKLKTVDRLCEYLGLELKPKATGRK